MEEKVYGNLKSIGFDINTDISAELAGVLREQYITLENMFADIMNGSLEKINATWDKHETIVKRDNIGEHKGMFTNMSLKAMGLKPGDDYNDWLFKWTIDVLGYVKQFSDSTGSLITMKCVRIDHEHWVLVGELKTNSKWFVYFAED